MWRYLATSAPLQLRYAVQLLLINKLQAPLYFITLAGVILVLGLPAIFRQQEATRLAHSLALLWRSFIQKISQRAGGRKKK
jgi:hypothetical protein